MRIFTVYDSKAEGFLRPFFAPTAGVAKRSFEAAANAVDHDFFRFAADYTLFEIGYFDEDTGKLIPSDSFENHGNAMMYRRDEISDRAFTLANDVRPAGEDK